MPNLQLNPNYRLFKKLNNKIESNSNRITALEQGGTGGSGSLLSILATKLYDDATPDAPLVLSPSITPYTKTIHTSVKAVNIEALGVGFELSDTKYPTYNYIESSRCGSQTNNVLPNMVFNYNVSIGVINLELRSLGGVYQLLHPILLIKYFDISTINIIDANIIPSWMGGKA